MPHGPMQGGTQPYGEFRPGNRNDLLMLLSAGKTRPIVLLSSRFRYVERPYHLSRFQPLSMSASNFGVNAQVE